MKSEVLNHIYLIEDSKIMNNDKNKMYVQQTKWQKVDQFIHLDIVFLLIITTTLVISMMVIILNQHTSGFKYCDTNLYHYYDSYHTKQTQCVECVEYGICQNGSLECNPNYELYNDTCVRDELLSYYEQKTLGYIQNRLEQQNGLHQCDRLNDIHLSLEQIHEICKQYS